MTTQTTYQFGTIMWAVNTARKLREEAINLIETKGGFKSITGIPERTKFYLALVTGCAYKGTKPLGRVSFDRGYLVMTENEYKYATGLMSSKEAHENVNCQYKALTGKKIIVAAGVLNGKPALVPVR
jgi:hypothetical protein